MLKTIADASRNVKDGTRTEPWLTALMGVYRGAARTPSRSPEQERSGGGSSGSICKKALKGPYKAL